MATKAPADMNAEEALEAYGYTKDGDIYHKGTVDTQIWQKVEGGWRMLERPAPGLVVGAQPWGRAAGDTGLIEVPYRQVAKYDGVSGLHPETHQDAFEWTWPEEKVAEIYAYGHTPDYGRPYKRNDEGQLVQDRSASRAEKDED